MFDMFCVRQVFDFLIRLHSADSSEEEDVFPFIRTLLHFDTREFLNVLAMVRLKIWFLFCLFLFVFSLAWFDGLMVYPVGWFPWFDCRRRCKCPWEDRLSLKYGKQRQL